MAEDKVKLHELLTIAQVAKILNVHIATLRRWDKIGKLKAIRVGTRGVLVKGDTEEKILLS